MATQASNDIVFSAEQLPVSVTGMQSMAGKMWLPFLAMGFMIIVAAFIVGLVNTATTAAYFENSKEQREEAPQGSDIATQKAFIEATKTWLPAFKFLGLGTLLGGITFLLATILGALRAGGGGVQARLGAEVRIPNPPITAQLFPLVMMMGMMILIAALVVAVVTAFQAYDYWNHSIATQLNPAGEGSGLLADLGTINAIKLWLAPFKFVGMALLFSGIGLALATIVQVLRWQSKRLFDVLGS